VRSVEISYDFTIEDWIRFNIWFTTNDPSQKTRSILLRVLPVTLLMVVGFVFAMTIKSLMWIAIGVFGIASIFWLVNFKSAQRDSIRKQIKKFAKDGRMASHFGAHTITLADEEMVCAAPHRSSQVAYDSIIGIVQDEDLTYIRLSAVSVIVVPDAAFSEQVPKDVFLAELRRRVEA